MIGKIIRMHRPRTRASAAGRHPHLAHLRDAVFALTRYIVDANPHALVERDGNILALTDYALAMRDGGAEPGEKVEACGARNLVGEDDLRAWQAQMLAVAARAPRVKAPLTHIILSLHEGERWTEQQRDEAITIVLETLQLERCPTVWAEHSNTAHPHIHLSVVRVDPETGKAAGSDWLIDDLHQALALIEERQGRIREPNALYVARRGIVYDRQTGQMVRDTSGQYAKGGKTPAAARERLPTKLHALRPALLVAAHDASSWQDLHARFHDVGATYEKVGSGARIAVECENFRASDFHRSLARRALEKRLGAFKPDIGHENSGYDAYIECIAQQQALLRARRDTDCDRIAHWLDASLARLPARSKPIAQTVRAEARSARAALRRAYADAITAYTRQKLSRDQWTPAGQPNAPQPVDAPALLFASARDAVERSWSPASQFVARHSAHATEYCDYQGRVQFTDHRLLIVVHAARDVAAIDAALQLAAQRWGTVHITGSAQFVARATERARVLGIAIAGENDAAHVARPMPAPVRPIPVAEKQPIRPLPPPLPVRTPAPAARPAPDSPSPATRGPLETGIAILANLEFIPMRRRRLAGDTRDTGLSGPLMIDLQAVKDPMDRRGLERVAAVQDLEDIQARLEARRRQQLDRWARDLAAAMPDSADDTDQAAEQRLPAGERIAATSARNDHDWLALLAAERKRKARRVLERQGSEDDLLALYTHLQRGGRDR
ncbi:relaxase/mobilization nuclease domain-containing protein [Sphingomonas sp. C3-2]|uniref:relaxase/mobilization nuclease domain-containing protein n=1 Tax=Sphingomonas sp. C3-2 TaxID=3062169 RepID=UPI00294AEA85|nr:relaxase/mobilization nuclease domain-containing protein [Sphingomonas sp. C3-2]WOK35462.1 LPD7 domain-containing protein [Sphingomonas sp. C3-2]